MKTIGIVIFPLVEELDFVAPFEVLNYVNKLAPQSTRVVLVAPTLEPVQAFNGLKVIPDVSFDNAPVFDILLFPGGKGRIVGTLIGALLLGFLNNGLNLLGVSSYYQMIVKAVVILLAVLVDNKKQ